MDVSVDRGQEFAFTCTFQSSPGSAANFEIVWTTPAALSVEQSATEISGDLIKSVLTFNATIAVRLGCIAVSTADEIQFTSDIGVVTLKCKYIKNR